MLRHLRTFALAVFVLAAPSAAWADTWFTVFAGVTTFSDAAYPGAGAAKTFGGSLAFKGKLGVEFDFAESPNVTGEADNSVDNARTFVVNVIADLGPRRGRIQPYASAGGGVVNFRVQSFGDLFKADSARNDFAIDFGGGAVIAASKAVAVRVDVRYFRSLQEFPTETGTANVGFVRLSGGLTFGF